MRNQAFSTFWHGAALSPLHWSCLSSFIRCGHRLRLFTYQDLQVPDGVKLEDASRILSEGQVFEFKDSFSAFSNIFRYKLLLEQGGWWVDTDVYCLREDIPECAYAWARQDQENINGAILRFPAEDPSLQAILDESMTIGRNIKVWGEMGPSLLTRHLAGREFTGHYGSTVSFYPLHWLESHLFWMPAGRDAVLARCGDSSFLHLWGSLYSQYGIDIRRQAPSGSFLQNIYERSGYPETLPELDEETRRKMATSIGAFLELPWMREASQRLLGHDVSEDAPAMLVRSMAKHSE